MKPFELSNEDGAVITVFPYSAVVIGIAWEHAGVAYTATASQARVIAGALLTAAQEIDPLPSTKPTPALAPDQLT